MRISDFTFNAPVTTTIHYSDAGVRVVADESQLSLWWWDGSAWQDASQTCDPPSTYMRDLEENVIGIPICRSGKYALFGPTEQAYLPIVFRQP
jgi:hypothetical protein